MLARRYVLRSDWYVAAPVDKTWSFLTAPDQSWSDWWPHLDDICVDRTEQMIGSVATCRWRSPLGYVLALRITLVDMTPQRALTLAVDGDLVGSGLIGFATAPGGSRIEIELELRSNRRWMRVAEAVTHPLFRWGHDAVMRRGECGLNAVLVVGQAPDDPTWTARPS